MKFSLLMTAVLASALVAGACKKDEAGESAAPSGDDKPVAGKTADTKPDQPTEPTAKKTDTPEAKLARFHECWKLFEARDAKFRDCYADQTHMEAVGAIPPVKATTADDAFKQATMWGSAFSEHKAQPQLVMISGDKMAAIIHTSGMHSGDLMGMPATNKKFSAMEGQIGEINNEGKVTRDLHYGDMPTMMHQLGIMKSDRAADEHKAWDAKVEVMAKDDDTEKNNVAVVQKGFEAINKKDDKALLELYADDATFQYMPDKKVANSKEAFAKGVKEYFGMSKDLEVSIDDAWGAGDWVVAQAASTGTMAVDMPGVDVKTKGKSFTTQELHFFNFADGKVKRHYVFENSIAMAAQLGLFDPTKMGGGAGAAKGDAPAKGAEPAKKEKAPAKKKAAKDEGGW